MSNPPDLQALARRYLDLWQDQWSAMAADPETPEIFAEMMRRSLVGAGLAASETLWQSFFAGFAGRASARDSAAGTAAGMAADEPGRDAAAPPVSSPAPPGTKTAAAAPAQRDDDLAELKDRLALLEQRFKSLEGSGAAADGEPRRRSSKSARPRGRRTPER